MKTCHNCGRITPGDPLFCNTCGRSFDKKLCPRLHPNPRSAEICSRCGSRELSVPQPKVSWGWRALEWFMRMFLGGLLLVLILFLIFEVLIAILTTPSGQNGVILLGFLIALLAWIWGKLPEWLRKFVRKQFTKRKGRHEEE
jgi:RNA polymerase subunit RPABC4/transcription elongation factor Spt4